MTIRPRFVLLALVSFSLRAPCSSTQTVVQNLYAVHRRRANDGRPGMAFFTDDFSMRSPDGKVHDRAEMTKYQRISAQTTKKVNSYSAAIEAVSHPKDADFTVIVLQKYDREQAPLEHPDQPHRIQTSAIQREVWRRTVSGPRIYRIEETMVGPVFIDGKLQDAR